MNDELDELRNKRSKLEKILEHEESTEADKETYRNLIAKIDRLIEKKELEKKNIGLHGMSMKLEQLSQRF